MSDARFNLDTAIATWRRFLRSERSITADDADELESHLRDEVDALRDRGLAPEDAFREAVRRMGEYAMLERAYRRVYWKKLRAERHVIEELKWRLIMLKNHWRMALRSVRKHRGYAAINVIGLSLGIACCILLLLYVRDEVRFDAFHTQADRIYRVVEDRNGEHVANTAGALAPALQGTYVEATHAVRLKPFIKIAAAYNDTRLLDFDYLLAEPSFFEVFNFELLRGDPQAALTEPNTAVVTESFARKLFGDIDPYGQTYTAGFWGDVTVTGVLRDPPYNSHLQFSQLLSFATLAPYETYMGTASWDSEGFITYVVLKEGDAAGLEEDIRSLISARSPEATEAGRQLYLQPLRAIHFGSEHIAFERNAHEGERAYLYIFAAIAFLIALIACINYMNLATAQSLSRAREIGMRKVVGARRGQLISQFLHESVLLALIALALALVLVRTSLPVINGLAGKALSLQGNGTFWLSLVGVAVLVGVAAGSYPAFYLSRLRPTLVLKSHRITGKGRSFLRSSLVVVQFVLSLAIMIGTLVLSEQLGYIQGKHLGFNQTHLLVMHVDDEVVENGVRPLKQALRQRAAIRQAAASTSVPGDWMDAATLRVAPVGEAATATLEARYIGIDEDFLETYDIALIDGRNFSETVALDTAALLINEAAARMLGWTAPVGRELRATQIGFGEGRRDVDFQGSVVGVVKDFHVESLHEEIKPMVLGHWARGIQSVEYFSVRISGEQIPATLAFLQQVHNTFDPANPIQYHFMDDRLRNFYEADQRARRVFGIAAALALLIACLGLFGLAAFSAQRRTKVIGVRKVLGSTVLSLVILLVRHFVKLVALAFVVAAPLAYLIMDHWLTGFAYRIEISGWTFLPAGLVALLVTLFTVSYHAIRAATADPVKSLRYE